MRILENTLRNKNDQTATFKWRFVRWLSGFACIFDGIVCILTFGFIQGSLHFEVTWWLLRIQGDTAEKIAEARYE